MDQMYLCLSKYKMTKSSTLGFQGSPTVMDRLGDQVGFFTQRRVMTAISLDWGCLRIQLGSNVPLFVQLQDDKIFNTWIPRLSHCHGHIGRPSWVLHARKSNDSNIIGLGLFEDSTWIKGTFVCPTTVVISRHTKLNVHGLTHRKLL